MIKLSSPNVNIRKKNTYGLFKIKKEKKKERKNNTSSGLLKTYRKLEESKFLAECLLLFLFLETLTNI